ncbi:MAG: hypothetical protein IPK03_01800 [Bacteroidetes bacterium]|nr:hypothetical protein [Bacteroidota bacterium]
MIIDIVLPLPLSLGSIMDIKGILYSFVPSMVLSAALASAQTLPLVLWTAQSMV